MIQDDNRRDKIAFARFINEHSLQLIGLLDTKTSIIVAITGVILALLFKSNVSHESLYLFYAVIILLGASAVSGLLTIFPRSERHPLSMIFHESIINRQQSDYKDELNSIDL